ncbi:MAG: hypothetical protein ACE365_00720 [Gammaproteobacteria bacterium]
MSSIKFSGASNNENALGAFLSSESAIEVAGLCFILGSENFNLVPSYKLPFIVNDIVEYYDALNSVAGEETKTPENHIESLNVFTRSLVYFFLKHEDLDSAGMLIQSAGIFFSDEHWVWLCNQAADIPQKARLYLLTLDHPLFSKLQCEQLLGNEFRLWSSMLGDEPPVDIETIMSVYAQHHNLHPRVSFQIYRDQIEHLDPEISAIFFFIEMESMPQESEERKADGDDVCFETLSHIVWQILCWPHLNDRLPILCRLFSARPEEISEEAYHSKEALNVIKTLWDGQAFEEEINQDTRLSLEGVLRAVDYYVDHHQGSRRRNSFTDIFRNLDLESAFHTKGKSRRHSIHAYQSREYSLFHVNEDEVFQKMHMLKTKLRSLLGMRDALERQSSFIIRHGK